MRLQITAALMIAAVLITGSASAQPAPNLTPLTNVARHKKVSVNAERGAMGPLLRAASSELAHMRASRPAEELFLVRLQTAQPRSWIGRHPILFGTLVGFGGGFLIGYLPGDDAVFDDTVGWFNGLVLGGVGAGVGALVGQFVAAGR